MAFSVLTVAAPLTASAWGEPEQTYDNYKYIVKNGEAYVTGYNGYATNVTIPAKLNGYKVVYIGKPTTDEPFGYKLTGFDKVVSLTIGNNVKIIYGNAFYKLASLKSVDIKDGVISIGRYAFTGCTSLSTIKIADSVIMIEPDSLSDTKWFENQSDGPVYIGKVLYGYKGNITKNYTLKIKDGTLGVSCAFGNITNDSIPNSIEYVSESAFTDTSWYKKQPNGLVYIGKCAYKYKGNIPSSITIKKGTKSISRRAFMQNTVYYYGCGNMPESFKNKSSSTNLKKIYIPQGLEYIDDSAFGNCCYLSTLEIPDSIKFIGETAYGYGDAGKNNYMPMKEYSFKIIGNSNTVAYDYAKLFKINFEANNNISYDKYKANKTKNLYLKSAYSVSTSSPYRNVVEQMKKENSVTSTEALMQTYLNLSSLDDLKGLTNQNEREYYYEIVLTDLLIKQKSSPDFNEILYNNTMSFANNLEDYFKDHIKDALKNGLKTNLRYNKALKDKIKNGLRNYDILQSEFDVVGVILDGSDVIGDFFDRIATYMAVKTLSEDTINILNIAANKTSNSALKNAIGKFTTAYNNNLSYIADYAQDKAAEEAYLLLLDKVADTALSSLPGSTIAKCIYNGGKFVSNLLTNSSTTATLYLQMSATYELEDCIRYALTDAEDRFYLRDSEENAKLFNAGFDLVLNTSNYGNNLLISYADGIDNALISKLQKELKINNGLSATIKSYEEFGQKNIVNVQNAVDRIYNNYIYDYPELWNQALTNYISKNKFHLTTYCDVKFGVSAISDENSVPKSAKLSVRDLKDEEKRRVESLVNKDNLVKAYDISLTDNGVKIQVSSDGYIIVRIPIPKGANLHHIVVTRIDEKGNKINYSASVVDGMIEFKTNHFSLYAILNNGIRLGDINNDGKISVEDATIVKKHCVGLLTVDDDMLDIADTNKDKKVNVADSTVIMKNVVGLSSSLAEKTPEKVIEPTSVTLSENSLLISKGDSAKLTALVTPSNAADKSVSWTSDNTSVATVTNGIITAKNCGTAVITAKTSNNKIAKCTVTVEEPYVNISSENELNNIRNNAGGKFRLTKDLNVNIPPIGTSDSPFRGVFDGNGHTITYNVVKGNVPNKTNYMSLFGYTEKATIKNLNAKGNISINSIASVSGLTWYCAGISAYDDRGTFVNCTNHTNITVDIENAENDISSYAYVGGIVGWCSGSTITKCVNYGKLTNSVSAHLRADANSGGIAGSAYNTNLNNCQNYGIIDSYAKASSPKYFTLAYSGGFLGSGQSCHLNSCLNYGAVSSDALPSVQTAYKSVSAAGGYIGYGGYGKSVSYTSCQSNNSNIKATGNQYCSIYRDSYIAYVY